MDLQFVEPEQVPVPAEQVRVVNVQATPYPDGRRVKVSVTLTPFLERPDVELRITDASGEALAEASVIECIEHHFEITLHLRQTASTPGRGRLHITVCYPDRNLEAGHSLEFSLAPDSG